jgi:hypothetical protein
MNIERYYNVEDYITMFNLTECYEKRKKFVDLVNFKPNIRYELVQKCEHYIKHPEKKEKIRLHLSDLKMYLGLPDVVFWTKDKDGKEYAISNSYCTEQMLLNQVKMDWFSKNFTFKLIFRKQKSDTYDKKQHDNFGIYSLHRPTILIVGPFV